MRVETSTGSGDNGRNSARVYAVINRNPYYAPRKHLYQLKDSAYDLPQEVVATLEDLYRVTSLEDVALKREEAAQRFAQTSENFGGARVKKI